MIQDYFSLDKKGNDYLLLRIINKVDFEEEVVWARDFSLSDRTGISKPIEQLMSYLKNGLDSLSDWNGDMEGFHSSIQHFGFENLLRTDNLIPAFILREDAKMPEINLLIFNELEKERETLGCKELETKVGLLHEALSSIGAKSYQPKDPEATVPVPLKLIFNKVSCPRKSSYVPVCQLSKGIYLFKQKFHFLIRLLKAIRRITGQDSFKGTGLK